MSKLRNNLFTMTIDSSLTREEVALLKELSARRIFDKFDGSVEDRNLPVHVTKLESSLYRSGRIYDLIGEYTRAKIYSIYGITLPDFLKMTINEISMLLLQAMKVKKIDDDALNQGLSNLGVN